MSISRRELLWSSAAVATSACLSRPRPRRPLGDDDLTTLVDEAVASAATPGIALSVWRDGREVLAYQAGHAELSSRVAVGAHTVFEIGSLTKQFAGAMVLELEAQGRLALTDPASRHLPMFASQPAFTIAELLNHTAGIHDGDYPPGLPRTRAQLEQAELLARQERLFDFPPGTAWLYSNANYILVGAIIEQVTGTSLAEAADRLLREKLGLTATAFDSADAIVPGRAHGYSPTGETSAPFAPAVVIDPALTGAAGAMRSTATELGRWHQALFAGVPLGAAMATAMTTPGRVRGGDLTSAHRFSPDDAVMGATEYGLGLRLDRATVDGSLLVAHEGGIPGFASYLATHVASNLTFACLCNVDLNPGVPFRALRRRVFRQVLPPA